MRHFTWLLCFLAAPLWAGTPFQIQGEVVAGGPVAVSAPANYAGVTVFRNGLPDLAAQVLGPDKNFPGRIYPAGKGPAFFLTDAGSQWSTPIHSGDTVCAVVETRAGLNGWNGGAYAGATVGIVSPASGYSMASCNLSSTALAPIPAPVLQAAGNTSLALSVGRFQDASGRFESLALFRKGPGDSAWQWISDLGDTAASQTFDDVSVSAGATYIYAVGVNYAWPGGGGAGSLPAEPGRYTTLALATGGPYVASAIQPGSQGGFSMAGVPGDWIVFPNPVSGGGVWLGYISPGDGEYRVEVYDLAGARVKGAGFVAQAAGAHKEEVDISTLAAGIYLVRMGRIEADGAVEWTGWRKLAVLK